jgi:hypothetical protein
MAVTLEEARLCALFEAGVLGAAGAVGEGGAARARAAAAALAAPLSTHPYTAPLLRLQAHLGVLDTYARDAGWERACHRLKEAWGTGGGVAHHSGATAVELYALAAGGGALEVLPALAGALAGALGRTGGEGRVCLDLPDPDEAVAADVVGMANFCREYGPRIANAEKNTGAAVYAFNALQRAFFPTHLQAPRTTIGGKHS